MGTPHTGASIARRAARVQRKQQPIFVMVAVGIGRGAENRASLPKSQAPLDNKKGAAVSGGSR
jgi:hypothetical protein